MRVVAEDRLARPHDRFECVLEVSAVRRAVLVEDHEVDVEQLQAPVLVGAQQLPDDVEVLDLVDSNEDDRQVAGDARGPTGRGASLVLGEQHWPTAAATGSE